MEALPAELHGMDAGFRLVEFTDYKKPNSG
jgi:hypothetical protein